MINKLFIPLISEVPFSMTRSEVMIVTPLYSETISEDRDSLLESTHALLSSAND